MGKYEKLIETIIEGKSDKNILFSDLCQLLKRLGFVERIRGSHHVFRKEGIEEKPNIQSDGNKAKGYQLEQIRAIILKYNLGGK